MSTVFKEDVWTTTQVKNKEITDMLTQALKLTYFVCILQMVIVHFFYGLEVNDSFHLGFMFVCRGEYKQSRSWTDSTVIKVASWLTSWFAVTLSPTF